MSEWGLTSERNSDGDRKPVEHEYTYAGEDVKIKLHPPTVTQLDEYEELGDETTPSELADIVDRHIVKPDIDPSDLTIRELDCYIEGIVSYGTEGGSDFVQEARDELEKRQGEQGN